MSNTTSSAAATTSIADTSSAPVTSDPITTTMSTTAPEAPTTSVETSSIVPPTTSELPSSTVEPTTSSEPPPPTTSSAPPVSTSTISESSVPPTTQVVTSVVTATPTAPGETAPPATTIVVTRTNSASSVPVTTEITSSATSSDPALNTGGSSSGSSGGGGGLSTGGITAIAVVVPVVVVALLVLAGIFLWRRRKAKKAAEEARRKEVEDYGFNPNNDPTLPAVASENGTEMAEDTSGYRGWGAAVGASRKMSTTLTSGHTQGQLSDAGSNGNAYMAAGAADGSDRNSGDAMLHQRRETMNSDQVGALGQAPVAGANPSGMKRGPSNASSTYSAGGHSDVSDPPPQNYDAYNPSAGYGYSQHGPYGDGTYGGASNPDGMPIVQDVSARRNTRIQQPGNYQQGNSGIAQNF
ncbi:hypothetical protein CB0940_04574 [Cercospora beticola]|uniref:Serine-rich protein n=1 Tax=Cercospora beticola TaxID=122368 RepID=A0A2G5HLF0_CERBT|nr:hypothetical protein CB0940_04574 [Cercospora beticola]PIA93379.1 hypothetical protein CB0940_04574 [Cercospora beticola]WPB01826.1 hypothetical protein RHO25_006458 [Cercospora beticola]